MQRISVKQRMTPLARNIRTLCSYGRSVSDICRRIGLNRQQFDRYLTGRTEPSLSTLRRICDFFGVDEAEILMEPRAFADLVRLRPPRLGTSPGPFDRRIAHLVNRRPETDTLLERHAGYYHAYNCPPSAHRYILRSLYRVERVDGAWISKSIERHATDNFSVPPTLRYAGIVLEGHGRIIVQEREQGRGRGFWTTILIASDHLPTFLPGIILGIDPEGTHDLSASRAVWHFLGQKPDLRAALRACGVVSPDDPGLADFVRNMALAERQQPNLGLIY